jgi:hypothetical protein
VSPAARKVLEAVAARSTAVDSRDKRWAQVTELQKAGYIRLLWNTEARLRGKSHPTAPSRSPTPVRPP